MPGLNREELEGRLEKDLAAWVELKSRMMDEEHVDDDSYPTEAALELITKWHWTDCRGLLEFIESIWHLADWGWKEVDSGELEPTDNDYSADGGPLLFVSTGGWSGNESIIRAFQDNMMAWHLCWIQSRRGGHYIFKPHEFKDDK